MNFNLFSLAYILVDFIGLYPLIKFMRSFHDNKIKNRNWEVLCYAFFYLITTLIYLFVRIPIVLAITNIIVYLLITLNYNAKTYKRLLAVCLYAFVVISSEMFIWLLFEYARIIPTEKQSLFPLNGYLGNVIIQTLIVFLFDGLKKINKKGYAEIIFGLGIGLDFALILCAFYFTPKISDNIQFTIISLVLIFCNYIIISYYENSRKHKEDIIEKNILQEENKGYLKQIEIMKMNAYNNDAFRHDLKNNMIIVKHLIETDDKEAALEQMNIYSKIFDKKSQVKTGVNIIDSILNSKFFEAEYAKIQVEQRIIIPYDISYDDLDITIILGNLMDFAVQSAKKVIAEEKKISFRMKFEMNNDEQGWLYIQVVHPILTTDAQEAQTKKVLNNVIKTIKKYQGKIKCDLVNNHFKINLDMLLIQH